MTAILDLEDLKTRIGSEELLQVAGFGSFNDEAGRDFDTGRINQAIAFATDTALGYLVARYPKVRDLTLETTPDQLKGICSDIVRYRLRNRAGDTNQTSEEVRNRYRDAISWLKDVSKGVCNLDFGGGNDEQGAVNQTGSVRASIPEERSSSILAGYQP